MPNPMRPNQPPSLLIIGGTGFVGLSLTSRLVAAGYRVTLPCRDRERVRQDLIALPGVNLIQADVHDPATLARLMPGHSAVINLVGILHGSAEAFRHAHTTLTEKLISAMHSAGIRRYVHMSALGADPAGPSHYLRSKGEAEQRVRASGLDWTIFRPSLIFGPGRCFVTMFADVLRLAPIVPLAGYHARMQPVWVEDVSRAFETALTHPGLIGRSLNLVGPRMYLLGELLQEIARTAGLCRLVFPLPDGLARVQATLMAVLPHPPLTHDNLDSLSVPNDDPAGFPPELGWQPTAFEAVLPALLNQSGPQARFLALRRRARS
ncbi:complex I NDUFA9 subunit family protein [Chitinimonas sp. BJYL2]|uniref:complex I NDUFA9 subunit family protein n=1 Tax=Chitinimonas sp. BJYL2 TaxID=2976696 RepID=UPI0022B3D704|nr:complex I NDUFA9 subunit family protein [Chitinimonas sp. BJYL2]